MDTPSPPPTTTPTTTKPDPDPKTRPETTTPKHLPPPFTNGVLKRLKPHHNHHQHHHTPIVITYKECLKNHAAALGGHAVDGCGEFMPSPSSTPADPTSLKCAACHCHRNFHRRDHPPPPPPPVHHLIEYQPHHRHHPPPPPPAPAPPFAGAGEHSDSPSPPPISSSYYPSAPHMLLALSSGVPAPADVAGAGKKRFRTKFTQEQKERMHELAERIGWKMMKKDEDLVMGVCSEIGVDRQVFKVWMHNNKNISKKDDQNEHARNGIDFFMNRNHHHNGSSSSS